MWKATKQVRRGRRRSRKAEQRARDGRVSSHRQEERKLFLFNSVEGRTIGPRGREWDTVSCWLEN